MSIKRIPMGAVALGFLCLQPTAMAGRGAWDRAGTEGRHHGREIALFSDGDFQDWTSVALGSPGSGGIMVLLDSGGNPGRCIEATTVLPDSPDTTQSYLVMSDASPLWDPAHDGIIEEIAIQLDTRSISAWGAGQYVRIALIQDETIYASRPGSLTGPSTDWHSFAVGPFGAEDFRSVYPWGSETPDFSSLGSPIRIGFVACNSANPYSPYEYTQIYDNWMAELTYTPGMSAVPPLLDTLHASRPAIGVVVKEPTGLARVEFFLPVASSAQVSLLDVCGRLHAVQNCGHLPAGNHSCVMPLTSAPTGFRETGIFFVRLLTTEQVDKRKVLLSD